MKQFRRLLAGTIIGISSFFSNPAIASIENAQKYQSELVSLINNVDSDVNKVDFSDIKSIKKLRKVIEKAIPLVKKITHELREEEVKKENILFRGTANKKRVQAERILYYLKSLLKELESIERIDLESRKINHQLSHAENLSEITRIIKELEDEDEIYKEFRNSGIEVKSIKDSVNEQIRSTINLVMVLPESDQKDVLNRISGLQSVLEEETVRAVRRSRRR